MNATIRTIRNTHRAARTTAKALNYRTSCAKQSCGPRRYRARTWRTRG